MTDSVFSDDKVIRWMEYCIIVIAIIGLIVVIYYTRRDVSMVVNGVVV